MRFIFLLSADGYTINQLALLGEEKSKVNLERIPLYLLDRTKPFATSDTNGMTSRPDEPIKIMFVCLGNICRSPLAEAVFRETARRCEVSDHFEIVSSGTGGYHTGEGADERMRRTARRQGLSLEDHAAQQFTAEHLAHYDHIFVMDKSNLNDVLHLDSEDEYNGKVRLFREFDPNPGTFQVPDPYHGGEQGFRKVYDIVKRTSEKIMERLTEEYELDTHVETTS